MNEFVIGINIKLIFILKTRIKIIKIGIDFMYILLTFYEIIIVDG